jgi:Tfp pilus assembly protein PilN
LRVPKAYVPAAIVLVCAVAIAIGVCGLARLRLAQAVDLEINQRGRLLDAQQALLRAKLATRDVNTLVALDATISDVRESGFRRASFLTKLGAQIPRGAWLETVAPDGLRITITGRALNLSDVASAIGGLSRASFEHVTLDGVTRILVTGRPPQIAFVLDVDGDVR